MASLVITLIGDDRAGLVDAVSGAVAANNGNWEQSHLAELAGKFAGVILVKVPDSKLDALTADLDAIEGSGLLDLTVERASETEESGETAGLTLSLMGQDHPGIVHDLSHALAEAGVSINELETSTEPASQGGYLFRATATLTAPAGADLDAIERSLEAVANDLMVDLDLSDA